MMYLGVSLEILANIVEHLAIDGTDNLLAIALHIDQSGSAEFFQMV
jgi:hypothetical protein